MALWIPPSERRDFLNQISGIDYIDEGFELIETAKNYIPGHPKEDCMWFVFRNEPWYLSNIHLYSRIVDIRRLVFNTAFDFLREKGYHEVEIPQSSDIVVYVDIMKAQSTHFGSFSDGKVISKFSDYHAFRHSLEDIPGVYGEKGNVARFLRKIIL